MKVRIHLRSVLEIGRGENDNFRNDECITLKLSFFAWLHALFFGLDLYMNSLCFPTGNGERDDQDKDIENVSGLESDLGGDLKHISIPDVLALLEGKTFETDINTPPTKGLTKRDRMLESLSLKGSTKKPKITTHSKYGEGQVSSKRAVKSNKPSNKGGKHSKALLECMDKRSVQAFGLQLGNGDVVYPNDSGEFSVDVFLQGIPARGKNAVKPSKADMGNSHVSVGTSKDKDAEDARIRQSDFTREFAHRWRALERPKRVPYRPT